MPWEDKLNLSVPFGWKSKSSIMQCINVVAWGNLILGCGIGLLLLFLQITFKDSSGTGQIV